MKLYVAQVLTGEELTIRSRLWDKGITAVVPQESRPIHQRGAWVLHDYRLFPSYVFVGAERMDTTLYYQVKSVPGVIRLLGNGWPQSLSEDEAAYLKVLAPTAAPLQPSVAQIGANGQLHIIDGVLTSSTLEVLKIDRHARRAKVKVPLLHKDKTVWLGIRIEEGDQHEPKETVLQAERSAPLEKLPPTGSGRALQALLSRAKARNKNPLPFCPLRFGYELGQRVQKVLKKHFPFKKSHLCRRLMRPGSNGWATNCATNSEQPC